MVLRVASVDLLSVNGGRVVNPGINACLVKGRAKAARVFNQKAILMPGVFGSWPYVWKDDAAQFCKSSIVGSSDLAPSCQPLVETFQLDASNGGRHF